MQGRLGQKGQVLPLVAVLLTVLMGFGGMAVDVGYWEYRQQAQQSATDAAAIGGAQQLVRSDCSGSTGAQDAALADATSNGFPNAGNVTVQANSPPQTGPFAGNGCAVSVQITSKHVASFFTNLFGYATTGATESTQAIAMARASNSGCVYLLSATQVSDISNAHVYAPQCGIIINDTANMSNSTINVADITYSGAAPNISGATFPEATPVPALPVADPCPEIAGCAYLKNNPPSTSGCGAGGTYNNYALGPGCYQKLTLTGTDTLSQGLYVINGQFHLNNATVTGSGVTIYMTANVQDTNFSGAKLTLTPPTSGSTSGVLLYRNPAQSSALDFSTCTCNFSGLLYFPTTQVNYSSAGGNYTVLIFGNANFSTSSTLDFGAPPAGGTLVTQAVITE
jgi:hypothetical protein